MADEELTVDEFAQRVGLPATTIRMYQTKGILPPPKRVGRSGYYGPGHLARLELIGRLQERGFSLAAIAELVQGWEAGQSLDDLLGLEGSVSAVLSGRAAPPLTMSLAELAERFPSMELSPEIVHWVLALGLLELGDDGATVVIPEPAYLAVGSELVDLGFPIEDVLGQYEDLAEEMERVAQGFAELFEQAVWAPFVAAGMPADELPRVTGTLERLAPLADRIVQAALRQALGRVAERFLAEQAAGGPPPKGGRATRGRGRR